MQILYKAVDYKPQHIYMTIVAVFILSQDSSFNRTVQALVSQWLAYYLFSSLIRLLTLLSNLSLCFLDAFRLAYYLIMMIVMMGRKCPR